MVKHLLAARRAANRQHNRTQEDKGGSNDWNPLSTKGGRKALAKKVIEEEQTMPPKRGVGSNRGRPGKRKAGKQLCSSDDSSEGSEGETQTAKTGLSLLLQAAEKPTLPEKEKRPPLRIPVYLVPRNSVMFDQQAPVVTIKVSPDKTYSVLHLKELAGTAIEDARERLFDLIGGHNCLPSPPCCPQKSIRSTSC